MIKKTNRSLKKSSIINTRPVSVTTGISVMHCGSNVAVNVVKRRPPIIRQNARSTFCDSL